MEISSTLYKPTRRGAHTGYLHSPLTLLKFRSLSILGTLTDFRYISHIHPVHRSESTFQSNAPRFRKSTDFRIPRLHTFSFPIRATSRWRWVCIEHWRNDTDKGTPNYWGKNPVLELLCPLEISHVQTWDRTRASPELYLHIQSVPRSKHTPCRL